ncbi:RNA polymerase subunit sigma-70 [Nonomuraea sp. NPDC050556]|uniref:RNA polymerase subunit sigma-70 n=1 Tax=Nonomuraea sp. NPDC050556 TaxID=3364369 RepID=UPI0037AF8A2F
MNAEAFRELVEPYRQELQLHCYRMLGSFHDAEDAMQDTLLHAWQGLDDFEGRSSIRTWLYRIATNRCLNTLRAASRRPALEWDAPGLHPPDPTRLGEIVWLEPYPDVLLEYERKESISLAFVTALQLLPPRQVAVLVLRDVLGFSANEVAETLDTTVESVNSALKRARANLRRRLPQDPAPVAETVVAKFVHAYSSGDVEALVALLTDDVTVSMPPVPLEYHGVADAARFYASVIRPDRLYDLVPTRANGQPAFATYLRGHATGLLVLTLSADGERISAVTRFDNSVLASFGLPLSCATPSSARPGRPGAGTRAVAADPS